MSWAQAADAIAGACFLVGAFLALIAAIGILRLPDLLSRMHAATKPQVLGLWLVLIGLGFRLREPGAIGILVLVALFQLLTTPVANHMMGRASIRAGQVREELLVVNDLDRVASDHQEPRGAP
ncbi:monovalent cation/H(+) antiporter subunit G [Nocardioides glacieisoli]|uniref:Monovalent cation/H(+) antiporter subunit G n=1 Tax=Nocardioides glacieisoli TaxID=1168730 RepID=A0A4Q2RNZ9_9ACTN|nr:monovalent cation/H(+) antiporter subunit G [Nocardioides glacieisoli]RYB90621.1 monovalent cation/H(+) antiporter subunit G [Nocardioides glacieisoli]